jgi:hypothetical protein
MSRRLTVALAAAYTLSMMLLSSIARSAAPAGSAAPAAPAPVPGRVEVDPAIFERALKDFYSGRYPEAAAGFWGYVRFGTTAAEKYEWAQFLLAESLAHLQLWHAATRYYYQVAKTRSQPEILPEALARLEAITRYRPFSESLIYEDLLYDSEFGTLPPRLSDWVQYVQGLYDYRNDYVDWAERHFNAIRPSSPYAAQAQYVRAVHAIKNQRDSTGMKLLDQIITSPNAEPRTKNEAYLAKARLLFDRAQYQEAMAAYEEVKQINLSVEQAELLLEKAWTAYRLQDYRRAMGLLHALYAPSYARFFVPDAYLLRGLILRELCHFIAAKGAVREFRFAFGPTIASLHRRAAMEKIPVLVEAVREQDALGHIARTMDTLQAERKMIQSFAGDWEGVELDKQLRHLYDLELREQKRQWDNSFTKIVDRLAETLLESEEQINLLDYEVGLDIFKRFKTGEVTQGPPQELTVPYDSASVYYEFDKEFWNDELHSYNYFINSRCFETGETP